MLRLRFIVVVAVVLATVVVVAVAAIVLFVGFFAKLPSCPVAKLPQIWIWIWPPVAVQGDAAARRVSQRLCMCVCTYSIHAHFNLYCATHTHTHTHSGTTPDDDAIIQIPRATLHTNNACKACHMPWPPPAAYVSVCECVGVCDPQVLLLLPRLAAPASAPLRGCR